MFTHGKKVVTRMAPSPTGHLHVGTARTALYNYLYAKNKGGDFIVRCEDTDKERSTAAFEEEIIAGLTWLGMSWDAYYRQSERSEVYRPYLEQAIADGAAYRSKEDSTREPGTEIEVVRLKNPNKTITFEDEIRGEVTMDTTDLGDFVIARAIDDPLFHFVNVVDDHEMGVTHIIRGEDHIPNTPRQILIQEALGFERPTYAHLPLLLAPDRSKLSKRHGPVSLTQYAEKGYMPGAITNYLALLGWNPGTDQEVFTLDELVSEFDIAGVQKGGAIFDIEKLRWMNREHMSRLSDDEFRIMVTDRMPDTQKALPQYTGARLEKLAPIIRERVSVAYDIAQEAEKGEYDFAFAAPKPPAEMLMWKKDEHVRDPLPRLQKVAEILSTIPDACTADDAKNALWNYAEEIGKGEVLWPLRVALSGRERSPDPFTLIHILGSAESYKRVQSACDTILSA
ncbi:MAG: glutamate--tRNA ligase [Candidatus Pacebacteria bacterium]|nr:glutamate--tRNA ligase [Candidatus Paceibacterota bacterium]